MLYHWYWALCNNTASFGPPLAHQMTYNNHKFLIYIYIYIYIYILQRTSRHFISENNSAKLRGDVYSAAKIQTFTTKCSASETLLVTIYIHRYLKLKLTDTNISNLNTGLVKIFNKLSQRSIKRNKALIQFKNYIITILHGVSNSWYTDGKD